MIAWQSKQKRERKHDLQLSHIETTTTHFDGEITTQRSAKAMFRKMPDLPIKYTYWLIFNIPVNLLNFRCIFVECNS